jgi:hypothetical protein
MDPSTHTEPLTEEALAADLGVSRDTLVRLRREIPLVIGDDYAPVPRRGITLTPAGIQKIKATLAPAVAPDGPQKNTAPPAPPVAAAGVTVIVRQFSHNGRACLCTIEGKEGQHRAFVMPTARQKATTLAPGMRLEGCIHINPEMLTYPGPVPARRGLPMPEKKEAAV